MIYVDRLMPCKANKNWRYNHVSHLTTDGDIEELHAFAKRLGLKRSWFQGGRHPHYDLTGSKRVQAIQLGAVQKGKGKSDVLADYQIEAKDDMFS